MFMIVGLVALALLFMARIGGLVRLGAILVLTCAFLRFLLQGANALLVSCIRLMTTAHVVVHYAALHHTETLLSIAAVLIAACVVLGSAIVLRKAASAAAVRARAWAVARIADYRMRRACASLMRLKQTVTPQSLAQAAGVDQETAFEYLGRAAMQSFQTLRAEAAARAGR